MSESETQGTRQCVSCGIQVAGMNAARFSCPDCGETIHRCAKCRKQSNPLRVSPTAASGALTMGDVAAKIKVMPNSPDIDLDDLQDRLEESLPQGAKIRGFPARRCRVRARRPPPPTVIVPDGAGGTEAVEEAFNEVDGVESVAVENVGRL